MSKVVIIKNDQGRLEGIDPQGQRAYLKWRRQVIEHGVEARSDAQG